MLLDRDQKINGNNKATIFLSSFSWAKIFYEGRDNGILSRLHIIS